MKPVVFNKSICEKGFVSYDGLRNTIVLIRPLSQCLDGGLIYEVFLCRSPEKICGTIKNKENDILVLVKFNLTMT